MNSTTEVNSALAEILRQPLLLKAGAWLSGQFRRDPGITLRPPFAGMGFHERLRDVPVPDWPFPDEERRSRDALDLFVRAGLLSKNGDGAYGEIAECRRRLGALSLYSYRDVERISERFQGFREAAVRRRVLDAGCGVGAYALYFRDIGALSVVALDIGSDSLAVTKLFAAATGGGVQIVRGSVERLPLPDRSFDLIHSRVVIPYAHQRRTISEFARVLRSGGRAMMMLHAASFYLWQLSEIGVRPRLASDAMLAVVGLGGGAAYAWIGWEPRWSTGRNRFYLSYQSRRAFSRLVESNGFRIDAWDANGHKPIVWMSRA